MTHTCLPVHIKTLPKLPFCLLLILWGSDSAQPEPILGSKRYRSALKFPFLSLITLTGTLISAFQLPPLFCKIIYTTFYILNQALVLKSLLDIWSFLLFTHWQNTFFLWFHSTKGIRVKNKRKKNKKNLTLLFLPDYWKLHQRSLGVQHTIY